MPGWIFWPGIFLVLLAFADFSILWPPICCSFPSEKEEVTTTLIEVEAMNHFTQNLAVTKIDSSVQTLYDDFQEDFRKWYSILCSWAKVPYRVEDDNGNITHVHAKQRAAELSSLYSAQEQLLIERFMRVFLGASKEASSSYSLFYDKYAPNGAKKTAALKEFLGEIPTLDDSQVEKKANTNKNCKRITVKEWRDFAAQFNKLGIDAIWGKLKEKITSPDRGVGLQVRGFVSERCKHPENAGYCRQLCQKLTEQVKSTVRICELYIQETADLQSEIGNKTKQPEVKKCFDLLCQLSDELRDVNSGLSGRVLFQSIKDIQGGKDSDRKNKVCRTVMSDDKYLCLIDSDKKIVQRAFQAWKLSITLKKRQEKLYPKQRSHQNDVPMPFGLTGLASFDVSPDGSKFTFSEGSVETKPSLYFDGLRFQKNKHSFDMEYRVAYASRRTKKGRRPKRVGRLRKATLKQVELFNKGGKFVIKLPHGIELPEHRAKLATFLMCADPKEKGYSKGGLVDEFRALAIDVNLSNPLAACVADVSKHGDGPIQALDYGRAKLCVDPFFLVANTPVCGQLIKLCKECKAVVQAIKEFKECQAAGSDFSFETDLFLPAGHSPRHRIQSKVQELSRVLRDWKFKLQNTNQVAEMIRLLELMDAYQSMISSYQRIHLKAGQTLPPQKKNSTKRANYRKDISRRLAFVVADYAQSLNVDVVFGEDLKADFDRDKNTNSLSRLFAGGMFLQHLENALAIRGIAFVKCAKNGTSITDPVSGVFGWRDKFNKERLWIERDGELGWVNSDHAACLNVLLVGLMHSVVPYRVYVKAGRKTTDDVEVFEEDHPIGPRKKRFFELCFGENKPKFEVVENRVILDNAGTYQGFIYAHCLDAMQSEKQHWAEYDRIKELALAETNPKQFGLTPKKGEGYRNFCQPDIHEQVEVVGNKRVAATKQILESLADEKIEAT
jgi:hypothetical protein